MLNFPVILWRLPFYDITELLAATAPILEWVGLRPPPSPTSSPLQQLVDVSLSPICIVMNQNSESVRKQSKLQKHIHIKSVRLERLLRWWQLLPTIFLGFDQSMRYMYCLVANFSANSHLFNVKPRHDELLILCTYMWYRLILGWQIFVLLILSYSEIMF
jgi:hypothetical protein